MSTSNTNPFSIDNIPFGVISTASNPAPRCATALDHDAIDLGALESDGFFDSIQGFGHVSIFCKVAIL
jgi:fumarylacetoacetase